MSSAPQGLHPRHRLLHGKLHVPNKENQGFSPTKGGIKMARLTTADKPFTFSSQRLDWRTLHGVDLDLLARHTDVGALERCLDAGLAHGDLEAEEPGTLTLTNVLRVARLSQMAIQYLLALQEGFQSEQAALQAAAAKAEALWAEEQAHNAQLQEKLDSQRQHVQTAKQEIVRLQKQLQRLKYLTSAHQLQETSKTSPEPTAAPAAGSIAGDEKLVDWLKVEVERLRQADSSASQLHDEVAQLKQCVADKDIQIGKLEALLQAVQDAGAKQEHVMGEASTSIRKLQRLLEASQGASQVDKQHMNSVLRKYASLERQATEMRNEIRRLQSRPLHDPAKDRQILQLNQTVLQLEQKLADMQGLADEAKQLAQDLEGLREYIASLEAQLANIHGNDDRHKIVRKYNDLLDKYHDSEKKRRSLATQLKAMLHERAEQESKLKITLQQVQEHKEALLQEQHQAQARHEAEVSELWRKVDEGTERLAAVKRDMQLARQDMDNAREDMQHAQTDLDAYIARRPDSAIDRRW